MGAGRKTQCIVGGAEKPLGGGGHPADTPHLPGCELGIAAHALVPGSGIALGLHGPGGKHLLAQVCAALGGGAGVELVKGNGVHLHTEVDAVQQGPDTRLRYCRTALGEQVQGRVGWP